MADPTTSLPDGFQLDNAPARTPASSSLPAGFQLDSAADMAAAWRKRTGAAPDVPTPFDSGLPHSVPTKDMFDRAEQFSSAAGDTLTAGIERAAAGANMISGGIAATVGRQDAADRLFARTQAEREDAARLAAQGAGQNKAGAITGNVLSYVPLIMTGGTAAPGLIGGEQALDTAGNVVERGGTTGQAEKAFATALPLDVAVNAIPGRLPLGSSTLGQAIAPVAGSLAAAGGQAASQEIQHAVSPQFVQAPTVSDASTQAGVNLLTAILTGGHPEAPETVDPYLRNYQEGRANAPAPPPQPAALPAPTSEPSAQAAPPAPSQAPTTPSSRAPDTALAAASFRADPRTALNALDHPTLVQVAQDAGFDVSAKDSPKAIVDTILEQPASYLESDVLPEYLANLSEVPAHEAAQSGQKPAGAQTPMPQAPTPSTPEPAARSIEPGATIPIDTQGTAYTPEQGAQSFNEALDRARGISGRLPEPVTTVDTQGNAIDSASFTRALDQAREQAQGKLDRGLTPDIVRTQEQHPGFPLDEVVGESDLTPTDPEAFGKQPWWRAGQDAAEQYNSIRSSDAAYGTPDRHPWVDLDDTQNVPLAGAASEDGNTVYVSKYMPDTVEAGGKTVDAKEGVFVHEVEEQKNMIPDGPKSPDYMASLRADIAQEGARVPEVVLQKVQKGIALPYAQAHHIATIRENAFIRKKYGIDPQLYQNALSNGIEAAKAGAKAEGGIPEDIDRRPYDDEGDGHLLDKGVSAELSKIGIPSELHPQAVDFLSHVQEALEAGVKQSDLMDIAKEPSMSYAEKVSLINHLTDQHGPRNELGDVDSWIVREKATGKPVFETFNKRDLKNLNTDKYEAVPALQHLQENNGAHTRHPESESVPRETATGALRQAGEAGKPTAQQGLAETGNAAGEGQHEPAISDRSDQLAEAPQQGGVPVAMRRDDWSPQIEGRAITEIDSLIQRYGGSTLADSIANDLREHTTAQLIGQHIEGPEDLAALASVYRNPAFETMRYVYVDRAGNILGETAVSSRMPSTTHAFPTGTDNGAVWVKEKAPQGATGVWLIHNHPSGDPTASRPDISMTQSLSIRLGDMAGAPKLQGHVILDHNTFGHIDALGEFQGVQNLKGAPDIDVNRYGRGDFEMFEQRVTDPTFAAVTGKRIAAATPEDSSAVVIMDAQRRVVSVHTFPNDFLVTPRGAAMLSRLGVKRGAVGIGLVTSTSNYAKHRAAFEAGAARGLLRDATVVSPDGRGLSLNDTQLFPREQRKNYGQQSAGARARASGAVQAFENTPDVSPTMVSLSAVRRALTNRGMTEDQIKAMTPEQLRAEQATMRRRSEPTPEETKGGDTSSITNATLDEERAMKGKDALQFNQSRANAAAAAEAKDLLRRDPQAGAKIAAGILAHERALTQVESFVLRQDRLRIKADRRAAFAKIEAARASGNAMAEAAARVQADVADDQMEINEQALKTGKGLAAQALQANRDLDDDSYSMSRMVHDTKERKGAALSSPERDALEKKAAEIEKREQAVAAREQALRDARREPRKPAEQKAAKSKFDSLADQLKAIAQKDHMKPGCVV